jgi:plastocyanin
MKDFYVRRGAHWIVTSLFLTVAACGGDSGTNAGDDTGNGNGTDPTVTTSVTVSDDFFNPASIQVSPGVTVMWTWSSNRIHNVTFADNAISDSGDQGGSMYQTAMPTASGLYTYQCTIHAGMNGTVTVQ